MQITTMKAFQQRRLSSLLLAALALVAMPAVASAQCHYERFTALADGAKFGFMGSATGTFANLDPVADGITVDLDGTPATVPAGAYAGSGTAGWMNLGGRCDVPSRRSVANLTPCPSVSTRRRHRGPDRRHDGRPAGAALLRRSPDPL